MKKEWIKKLIELLNESEDWFVSKFVSYDDVSQEFVLNTGQCFYQWCILSKSYGFVERLVENKKLKLEYPFKIVKFLNGDIYWWADPDYYSDYESLLMKLSIQDNPVEYLVNLLN